MSSYPPSLKTSLLAPFTDLSKLGTTTWIEEVEVMVSIARGQVLLNTNNTGQLGTRASGFSHWRGIQTESPRCSNSPLTPSIRNLCPEWGKAPLQPKPNLAVHQWLSNIGMYQNELVSSLHPNHRLLLSSWFRNLRQVPRIGSSTELSANAVPSSLHVPTLWTLVCIIVKPPLRMEPQIKTQPNASPLTSFRWGFRSPCLDYI